MSFYYLVVCFLFLVSAHALCGCLNTSCPSGYELDHQLGLQSCSIIQLLQIAVHLQQMQKIGPFGKSGKGFLHIQNGPKGF
jgi:hypothetical protein